MLYSEKSEANISSWSYDMEGHAKKCVEKYHCGKNNYSFDAFTGPIVLELI